MRGWRPLAVWSLGFAFAALAALVKGPQAPVYFGAITAAYLAVLRDWRYLFSWQAVAGAPGLRRHHRRLADSVLSGDRLGERPRHLGRPGRRSHPPRGVLSHAVTYPVETFACLLPWSPMLIRARPPRNANTACAISAAAPHFC